MISIQVNFVKEIQFAFVDLIVKQRRKALEKLYLIDDSLFSLEEQQYLKKVRKLFRLKKTLLLLPEELDAIKLSEDWILPPNSRANNDSLKLYILKALDYKSKRSSFYPSYFHKIGIKSCVYCNSQYTITAQKTNRQLSAKFDVDHYLSKDEYPFLSICLFNLYPACAPCNRAKSRSNDNIKFDLYVSDSERCSKSEFTFKLCPISKAKYLLNRDPSKLEVLFNDTSESFVSRSSENFNKVFAIKGIYDTQKDVVEELILKSQIYNDSYKNSLRKSFLSLSLNPILFERILVGNYTKETDLHKRPMSKFMQDIAKELGIIPQEGAGGDK